MHTHKRVKGRVMNRDKINEIDDYKHDLQSLSFYYGTQGDYNKKVEAKALWNELDKAQWKLATRHQTASRKLINKAAAFINEAQAENINWQTRKA